MVSLAKAVPGVMNAFIILLIVMSIYAILAVELFRDHGKGGAYRNSRGDEVAYESTARGLDFGEEYFGHFSASLYTMFQVLTGDTWSEGVARPLVYGGDRRVGLMATAFFCSFVVVNAIALINVV